MTENDFLVALQADLTAEFQSAGITFAVLDTQTNFSATARTGVARIDASTGYQAARQNLDLSLGVADEGDGPMRERIKRARRA